MYTYICTFIKKKQYRLYIYEEKIDTVSKLLLSELHSKIQHCLGAGQRSQDPGTQHRFEQ